MPLDHLHTLSGHPLAEVSQVLGALLAALPLRVDMEEAECVSSALCHLLLNAPRMEAAIELVQPLVEVRLLGACPPS